MKILFISHTYPPIVGGVETQNYELSFWLGKLTSLKLIANKKRFLLPFFLPLSAVRALWLVKNYDVLLLGSGLLGFTGWIVKKITNKPVISVTHGLDLTYKNILYQKLWVGIFIPSLDKLVAVGNETIRAGVKHGIPKDKFVFIPNGVDTEKYIGNYQKSDLEKVIGEKTNNKFFILTSGRLVKRKGVAWFITNVMPKLNNNVIYVVSGKGPDLENIKKAIRENNLEKRVILLGYIPDKSRDTLFNTCDIFVQPNIKIPDDMEGFGISVIEAASCKIPVIASRLEGLQDAIKHEKNGFLIEANDAEGYAQKIGELLQNKDFCKSFGEQARKYVVENYSWEKIASRYLDEINKTLSHD
jgi:glycosyltransferase involved in cell wall biosynthesis